MDTILASPELQAALSNLILAVITFAVTALTKVTYTYLKTHTSEKQFELLGALAEQGVAAAEQGAIAGFVSDRKATATAIVNEGLKSAGVKNLTADQIEASIEAAVKNTLNYDKTYGEIVADGGEDG